MKKMFLAAAAASVMISSAAYAAVTYDPATGGFAGKGDLQSAFGWNNAVMQENASGITFTWEIPGATYEVVCEFDTMDGKGRVKDHRTTDSITTSITGTVAGDPRAKRQDVTGFNLGAAVLSGGSTAVPQVNDPCKSGVGNSFNDRVTEVTLVSGGSGGGGLYATDPLTAAKVLIYAAP